MSDNNVATIVRSKDRWHSFQEYFVALKCEPAVMEIKFDGIEFAKPSPMLLATLESKELEGIVICPSNPFVSIDPILAIPGLRAHRSAQSTHCCRLADYRWPRRKGSGIENDERDVA